MTTAPEPLRTLDGAGRPGLSADELLRYSRHILLPEVGRGGQERLRRARVLIVGAGGLGSPVALYLAAAGVGTVGLVDFDVVEASNLQRQVLYTTADVGRPKLDAAAARIAGVNPGVQTEVHPTRLTSENALALVRAYDVVVDGTDNFPTRYLVNDACVLTGRPNVYGSIFRFEGQVAVFDAARGPCYRCLFPEPPPPGLVPSCTEGGVLGVLPGIIGTMQAAETLKLLLGVGEPLVGRILLLDVVPMTWRELRVRKDPTCPVCGPAPTQAGLIDYDHFCGGPAAASGAVPTITPAELARRLAAGERLVLVDVREPREWEEANLAELGARLVPLHALDARAAEFDRDADIVVYCQSGARSAQAARQLLSAGCGRVRSLAGGIASWQDVAGSPQR